MRDLIDAEIPPVEGVTVATELEGLRTFCAPDTAATIWQREIPKPVISWLSALSPDVLPSGRLVAVPSRMGEIAAQLCDIAQTPKGPERHWLEADIAQLAMAFADIMGASYLRMRLDVVETNACRKFHVDMITSRLVCTYRGTGTQYGLSDGC